VPVPQASSNENPRETTVTSPYLRSLPLATSTHIVTEEGGPSDDQSWVNGYRDGVVVSKAPLKKARAFGVFSPSGGFLRVLDARRQSVSLRLWRPLQQQHIEDIFFC
ncbi:unnamed protein product, partial [Ectocarpus sp. 4 AP-2014]